MFALEGVLVPTNLGEPSKAAIRYGVAFARQFGAKLYLAHVLPGKAYDAAIETERVMELLSTEANAADQPDPDPAGVERNAARESLGRLLDADDARATQAEYLLLRDGIHGPGHEIVLCAERLGVRLIVLGKHRAGFVEHLFAGGIAENVMRNAPCPVLVVHFPEHDFVVPET